MGTILQSFVNGFGTLLGSFINGFTTPIENAHRVTYLEKLSTLTRYLRTD